MKKTVTIICSIILIIVALIFIFYMYDMHNGKIENSPEYLNFYGTQLEEIFKDEDIYLEQQMQEFFANSDIKRQGDPITTPQQAKKIAQKVFFEQHGWEPVTTYRPYKVYHDDERKTWYVTGAPWIFDYLPVMAHEYFCAITDDGYIVASFLW